MCGAAAAATPRGSASGCRSGTAAPTAPAPGEDRLPWMVLRLQFPHLPLRPDHRPGLSASLLQIADPIRIPARNRSAVRLGEAEGAAPRRDEAPEPRDLDPALPATTPRALETGLSPGRVAADQWVQVAAQTEAVAVDPLRHQELELVPEAGAEEHPPSGRARCRRGGGPGRSRAVGEATPENPVQMPAATGHHAAARVGTAHMRPDRAAVAVMVIVDRGIIR